MKTQYLFTAVVLTAALKLTAENRTLFVSHAGGIDPILYAEVDSIRFSPIGIDSVMNTIPVVQEIWTPDTVYRYNIADIISVSFEAPATKANERAIDLSNGIAQYIEETGTTEWRESFIRLSTSTPEHLIPAYGQYIYQLKGSDKLPYGVAGQISRIDNHTLYYYDAKLRDIFDTLIWDAESDYTPDEALGRSSSEEINPGWLAAEIKYPYGSSVVIDMTDELRDIPVGPAEACIKSKIRIRPRISMAAGIYMLGGERGDDGEWITPPVETHKITSRLHARIEAHADGRASVDAEHNLGGDKRVSFKTPMGLGRYFNVSFTGTMKLKGLMGLNYDYSAEYRSASVSTVLTDRDKQIATMGNTFTNKVIQAPVHLLDASMEGSLSLSATISASLTNVTDSLKSVTNTYVYGSKLDGKALYLTSQLEEAETNDALYRRITNAGIKAIPIETVSASSKYGSITLKGKSDIKPSEATTYYAVPLFKSPLYSNGEMSYDIEGKSMNDHKSNLGFAIVNNNNITNRVATQAIWPGAQKLIGQVSADFKADDTVYPTATLSGHTILCAPPYPDNNQVLSPLISANKTNGIRIVCGATALGSANNGKTQVYIGNIVTVPKSKDK